MSKRPLNRWISALHIVLIVSMLVPTLSIISSERAQAAGDVPSAPNYQTARELASSADIRTYLPEELFLPFENERASSPWDFLDQKIPSPQELIPTLGGSQATQAQSSDPESQLALAQRYAQVLQTEATTGNAAAGNTENALEPIWHQPTLPASTGQAGLDVSTEITNSTVTASPNAAFSVYLPAVLGRTDSATVTPPVSQPTESYTLVSPDGVVTLRAPVSNFDSKPTFQYVALGAGAPNVAPLQCRGDFWRCRQRSAHWRGLPYLKQAPATLTIVHPATASGAGPARLWL
ncbi:MAG: hypothetical protein IPK16_30900 [Anaerolineales bacterium]|nr:hypothetical protein [Anaerolineales bacterium]